MPSNNSSTSTSNYLKNDNSSKDSSSTDSSSTDSSSTDSSSTDSSSTSISNTSISNTSSSSTNGASTQGTPTSNPSNNNSPLKDPVQETPEATPSKDIEAQIKEDYSLEKSNKPKNKSKTKPKKNKGNKGSNQKKQRNQKKTHKSRNIKNKLDRKTKEIGDDAKVAGQIFGLGCGIVLIVVFIFFLINIVNLAAIIVGLKNFKDDEGVCAIDKYDFPLSEWLVIVGFMGLFMTTCSAILVAALDSKEAGILIQVLWFLPEFALWICGIVILNNIENDCKEDFRQVWDMSVAWSVIRGLGFFILCCEGCYLKS